MPPSGKKHLQEMEFGTAEHQEFANLLDQFDYKFSRGDVIKGRVITMEPNGAMVDIGAKTAAYLPNKEMAGTGEDAIGPGKEFEFFILREENEDGQLTLSRRRVFTAQTWGKLQALMESDSVVDGTISSVVKGGLLVEVMGLRGFVPSSHLRVKQSLDSLVGEKLPFKILSMDPQRNNIILSHRKVVSEQVAEQRRELFQNIEVGSLLEGEVVRLTDFGAFIDLGGVDGLLPLSQMSWRWVEHPSDILKIGQSVKVEVIGVDHEKQRVSLSIKSQFEDPWNQVMNELGLGQQVEGTITRIKHFGAFVEIYPGVEALLPSRDITDYEASQGKPLESGQKIKTYIVKFNPEERRISLSFYPLGGGEADFQTGRFSEEVSP